MDTPNRITTQPPLLLSAILCEDEARSSRDGSLSLLRVFYVLRPATLPVKKDLVVVTFWWLRTVSQCVISTRLRDLEGGVLEELGSDVTANSSSIHEQSARFIGVEFSGAGRYRVEVLLDGDVVGAYPLYVEQPASAAPLIEPA